MNLINESASVIGAGSVGRQVALQLLALGFPKLRAFDSGIVAPKNESNEGFRFNDVGRANVDALGDLCHQTNPRLDFEGIQARLTVRHPIEPNVFYCLNATADRQRTWRVVQRRCRFWADVQVIEERVRVLIAHDEASRRHYSATLLRLRKTTSQRARSAAPSANVASLAASLAVYQFARYLRGQPVDFDATFDLSQGCYQIAKTNRA